MGLGEARIAPQAIRAATLEIGARADLDAVFQSCTNLLTVDVIDTVQQALREPVVSSKQALAWRLARLSGATPLDAACGHLMTPADALHRPKMAVGSKGRIILPFILC